ncbi:MAG: DUF167 domain-containing protein [Pseudomonadota bacterium]
MTGWYRRDCDGVLIDILVRPNAKASAVTGVLDDQNNGQILGVRLAAKPVDGAANKALTAFFAKQLGVAKSAIRLVGGQKSRTKRLHVDGDWKNLEPRLVALTEQHKP